MVNCNSISAATFSAFLQCPTKAYLLAIGEVQPDNYFSKLNSRLSDSYKDAALKNFIGGITIHEDDALLPGLLQSNNEDILYQDS